MSVFGTDTAIMSLGMSCQSAWQINRHVALLSELCGTPLTASSGPLDWVMTPLASTASWLRSAQRFPDTLDEIVIHPNFYWPKHNLHFWHEFMVNDTVALYDTFDKTKLKFEYLVSKFKDAARCNRLVFFVSNTQNNLDEVMRVSPAMDPRFDGPTMRALVEAIHATCGTHAEVHFVTRPDRLSAENIDSDLNVYLLGPDSSAVFGDDAQWADVFRDALTRNGKAVRPTMMAAE